MLTLILAERALEIHGPENSAVGEHPALWQIHRLLDEALEMDDDEPKVLETMSRVEWARHCLNGWSVRDCHQRLLLSLEVFLTPTVFVVGMWFLLVPDFASSAYPSSIPNHLDK